MQPRGSIETVVRRLIRMLCLMTWSAAANAFSVAALLPASWKNATLSRHSSQMSGASGAIASSSVVADGRSSYSTSISSAASFASLSVSAMIIATGSPM